MRFAHVAAFVALILVLVSAGCDTSAPIDRKIAADSTLNFAMWKARAMESLTTKQARDFEMVLQEYKFKIMADAEATGSVAIDAKMREKIDGQRISEVMRTGLVARLHRLETERIALEEALMHNLRLRTNPGDEESAQHLQAVRDADKRRLDAVKEDLTDTQRRFDALTESSPYLRAHPEMPKLTPGEPGTASRPSRQG